MMMVKQEIRDYVKAVPADRRPAFERLLKVVRENLPGGFDEVIQYRMPGFVVPHSAYPPGYHVDPNLPLPFINLANQKGYIALYHLGLYADSELLTWFKTSYAESVSHRLDMGKSCIRFRKIDEIPYDLIAELVSQMTVPDWIQLYEQSRRPR